MAVYTYITKEILLLFLKDYNIGNLESFENILEGVENTNYKIITSQNTFVLTIFEKRVNKQELPFFIKLQKHLSKKNIKCPNPIANKQGQYIQIIQNKPCVIMSFLDGEKINNVIPHHCYQVGELLANIHKLTNDFNAIRENNLHQTKWMDIFNKCKQAKDYRYNDLFEPIERELIYLKENWPKNLPKGIIHADVFQDNVFFINDSLSGLIDFYFSCNDFYAYELAIGINAWCFDEKVNFDQSKYTSMIKGYELIRNLSSKELIKLPILLRGAAMRFLLTRLHDKLYHQTKSYVTPKNPNEYFSILKFHQNNSLLNDNL